MEKGRDYGEVDPVMINTDIYRLGVVGCPTARDPPWAKSDFNGRPTSCIVPRPKSDEF